MERYSANGVQGGVAAQYSTFQFLNPAASGKIAIIKSIIINRANLVANSNIYLRRYDSNLSGTAMDRLLLDDIDSDNSSMITASSAEGSVLGTALEGWFFASSNESITPLKRIEDPDIILRANQGLLLVIGATNQSANGKFIWDEY